MHRTGYVVPRPAGAENPFVGRIDCTHTAVAEYFDNAVRPERANFARFGWRTKRGGGGRNVFRWRANP